MRLGPAPCSSHHSSTRARCVIHRLGSPGDTSLTILNSVRSTYYRLDRCIPRRGRDWPAGARRARRYLRRHGSLRRAFTLADETVVTCEVGCAGGVKYLALPNSTRAPLPGAIPRKADRAAADGQTRHALRRPRRQEERRGSTDVRADDVGSSQRHWSIRRAKNAPEASGAIRSGRPSEWPNPGRSMAITRPTAATWCQMRRKAQRVSGHGASSSTVMSESALLSANLTRTPSQTRK
jgi:hypothetical protein